MVIPAQYAWLTILTLGALAPGSAQAQWWTATPADYEECAERAHRSASKDATTLLATCDGQFAGRRRPGGGYTYYDFMQNRGFDIAGPNPTAAEQKAIDEHYTSYLDQHRRRVIAAAFAEKQREQQQAAVVVEAPAPIPAAAAGAPKDIRPVTAAAKPKARIKPPECDDALTCGWSKLSSGLSDIKKALFGAPPKTRRTG